MEACIYIGRRGNEWAEELFPGRSPGELPLAGKSYVRHALDICSSLKIEAVRVADSFFYEGLRERLAEEKYWLEHIDIIPEVRDALRPEELAARHKLVPPADGLLFFWGEVLPDVPEAENIFAELQAVEAADGGEALEDGVYLLRDGQLHRCVVPLLRMDSLKSYFDLNFRMLNAPGMYVLPGYAPEHDRIYFGENVIMMPNCRIESPVVIGKDSMLGRSVVLDGNVVIGESSLVESHSLLKNAVILNFTCIGRRMLIENKIVDGRRVIDAETGAFVDLSDNFLTRSAKSKRFSFYPVAEYLTALVLSIALAPWYLAALAMGKTGRKLPFFRFLRHVYPNCLKVLVGKARLVRIGADDRAYAFRFSDSQLAFKEPRRRDMDDILYANHRGVRLMLSVVLSSLGKRLFVLTLPDERENVK